MSFCKDTFDPKIVASLSTLERAKTAAFMLAHHCNLTHEAAGEFFKVSLAEIQFGFKLLNEYNLLEEIGVKKNQEVRHADKFMLDCETCIGKGVVTNPEMEKWMKQNSANFVELIKAGKAPEIPQSLQCEECGGKGWLVTEKGSEVLRLLKRAGFEPKAKD